MADRKTIAHTSSDVLHAVAFFKKAYPAPESKNFHTQLGVHFEEIKEMLDQLESKDPKSMFLLDLVSKATQAFSEYCKENDKAYEIKDRVEFLDGLCDQLVTASGLGYMANMDIAGGFGEVNNSNMSKFDRNGNPILDANKKMVKGPDYRKPELKQFV